MVWLSSFLKKMIFLMAMLVSIKSRQVSISPDHVTSATDH
jgi:hypothetical protein